MRAWTILGVSVLASLSALACDKGSDGVQVAPSASALAPSVAPATSMIVHYAIDPKGHTAIDMPGPKEHIKAETTVAGGTVDLDLMNLANTRGEVKVDLQSLATHTFDKEDDNKLQTEHAQTWLEAASKLPADQSMPNRFAVFAIRSIENPSVTDATKAPFTPGKDGKQEKKISATVKGEFLVHGHKVDKSADVDVTLIYPAGAKLDDKPAQIAIQTKTPMVVTLDEHDIKPRDNVGKIAKQAFNLLGTKVADKAGITFELTASPGTGAMMPSAMMPAMGSSSAMAGGMAPAMGTSPAMAPAMGASSAMAPAVGSSAGMAPAMGGSPAMAPTK